MFTSIKSSAYLFVPAASLPSLDSYPVKEDALKSRASFVESFQGKPRLFVLSDIGNEPDDQMSLTRLLLYSNEVDIEGLVATTSTWQKDTTKEPLFFTARVGAPVMLSAAGSRDPDGDKIAYSWFCYQEAASAISKPASPEEIIGRRGEDQLDVLPRVRIENSDSEEAIALPQSAGVAHIIVAVEDDGVPSLTSYRRVILEIED